VDPSPAPSTSTAAEPAATPPAPRAVKKRRRVWPWIVSALVVVVVAALALPALFAPRDASAGYLTAKAEVQTVTRTAQGTGSVVDARVLAIGADDSWSVASVDGVTASQTQTPTTGAAVTVKSVEVAVGDSVDKGDHLAVVEDASGESTTITAPRDGVVRTVDAYKGATASGTLFTLSTDGVRVAADISEYDIAHVAPKQKVAFSFDGLSAEAAGTVQSIGAAASTTASAGATGAVSSSVTDFPVVATISTAPKGLRVGMSVQMTIDVERAENVLAVPVQALDEASDGTYTVTVRDAAGTTRTVDVTVGLIGDSTAEITSGLSAGDEVVTGTAAAGSSSTVTPGFPGPGSGQ